MYRAITRAAALALMLAGAGAARAGVIVTSPDDFAVLAGGKVETGNDVRLGGHVGAGGQVWFGSGTQVDGPVFSTHKVETGSDVEVAGRIVASHDVYLGSRTTAGAIDSLKSVGLGTDVAAYGSVTADKRVDVNSRATVAGDVSYGTRAWIASSATVSGIVAKALDTPDTWAPVTRTAPELASDVAGHTWHPAGSAVNLAPDDYGQLDIGAGATVSLAAGTYDLKRLDLGSGGTVVADTRTGDVVLNIEGNLTAGSAVAFTTTGPGALTVNVGGHTYLGPDGSVAGNLFTWGNVDLDARTFINGSVYAAGNLWLASGAGVAGAPSEPIPEPATVGFVLLGAAALITWRSRRVDPVPALED